MYPTAKQIEETIAAQIRSDEKAAAERAKAYETAPTCWHCGDKFLPHDKAVYRDNECRHCERDLLNDFDDSTEEDL